MKTASELLNFLPSETASMNFHQPYYFNTVYIPMNWIGVML